MSHVVSSSAPITSAHTVKQYAGFGILGADIPTTGDNGGSPVLNDSIISTSEYHWRVETPPSAGVLTIHPDLTFDWDGTGVADGSYPWVYRLFEDGVSVGTATVNQTVGSLALVQSSRFENTNSFFAHGIAASINLAATRFDNAASYFTHNLQLDGGQSLTQSVRHDNANAFYSHNIAPGGVTLVASRFDNSNVFYAHAISQTGVNQSLAQSSRFDNAPTFYQQTITIGSVALNAGRFDNINSFPAHSITQGPAPQLLTASRFDNTSAFYQHTVSTGAVVLYPAFYQNQNVFFGHRIGGTKGRSKEVYVFTEAKSVVATATKQASVVCFNKSKQVTV